MKVKLFLFLILIPFTQLCLFGQTLVKDQPESGNKINCASFRVHLKPGYSFIPEGSESMEANISSECGPFFIVDTRDILDVVSFQINGAGLSGSYTSDDEYTFSPVVAYGTTDTIEITLVNADTNLITIITVELNDQLKIVSSTVTVEENGIPRTYSANNYLTNNSGGNLNFRIAQLYTELISKGCFSNNDINWNSAKHFDEEGNLISSSQSFFNYLGNPTQTQSKNFTNNTVIGMESVYDAYGRSVLTTLPAPMYQSSFCYNNEFIRDNANLSYDYTKFDVPNYTSNPPFFTSGEVDNPMYVNQATKGSVGWYYGGYNNEEPYVGLTNFPYSRVEYDPNNPGAIKRSSAPHNGLKMGSGHENKSFSMPVSGELNYLFGYAAGWTLHQNFDYIKNIQDWDSYEINNDLITNYNVTKNILVDADGHESISFVDVDGKLVATCNSGTRDNGNNARILPVTSFIKGQDNAERYIDIHLPEGTQTSIEIVNEFMNNDLNFPCYLFDILDLDRNVYVYQGVDGQSITLPAGYYRIINTSINCVSLTNTFKDNIAIRYNLNYYDFTLYYYDKAGRLVTTIAPTGIDESYDPHVLRTIVGDKKKFYAEFNDITNLTVPFLGPPPLNQVNVGLTPTPPGSQQFSMALVYLTEHTDAPPPSPLETGRVAGQPVSMSSGIGSFKLGDVKDDSHYDYIFTNECDGATTMISKQEVLLNYDCGSNDLPCLSQAANHAGMIKCDILHQDLIFVYSDTWSYCFVCAIRPKTDVDKRYDIVVNLSTNNALLRSNIKLVAEHHLVEGTNQTYWTFNLDPNQLFADAEGELIDVPTSVAATNLGAQVTSIKEWSRTSTYDGSWYYVQTYDYTYIHELDLNVAALTNEFSGDYPSHKPSEINQYNSISQVLKNITVDKGVTDYVYNEEGLLRFSRNNEQRVESRFSYVNYDELGRPIESGEYDQNLPSTGGMAVWFQNHYNEYPPILTSYPTTNPLVLNNSEFYDLNHSGKTKDINFTLYDAPDPTFYTATGLLATNYTQQIFLGDVSKTWNKSTENATENTVTTWYSYDDQGRVLWMVQKIKDLGVKTIDYQYNNAGDLIQVIYQKNNPIEYFAHQYSYDIDKRLINVTTSQDGLNWDQQAKYFYYQHGPLKRVELADNLQGIDYLYTSNGWLKSINSPSLGLVGPLVADYKDPGNDSPGTNGFAKDVFGMALDYFQYDYYNNNISLGVVAQPDIFNGNIKSVRWNSTKVDITLSGKHWMYSYQYNKKGWLKDATFGKFDTYIFVPNVDNDYKVSNLTYDKNGNILSLNRNAYGSTPGMDNLYYHYIPNTNQLAGVDNTYSSVFANALPASQLPPFNSTTPSTFEYEYDNNGALITNKKDDQSFIYNVSGLVTHVYNADGSKLIATYDYDDKGYRYKKTLYNSLGTTIVSNTFYIRDASGTIQHVYTQDVITPANNSSEYPIYGAGRLGNYYKDRATVYELTDHLGNVRATINRIKVGSDASVEEYADYYPFGEKMPGRNSTSSLLYKYGYQGQEHDDETGYDAFELRLWDGRLGRWMSTDPYGQYHSPYLGMGNNPISGVDPDGGFDGPIRDFFRGIGNKLNGYDWGCQSCLALGRTAELGRAANSGWLNDAFTHSLSNNTTNLNSLFGNNFKVTNLRITNTGSDIVSFYSSYTNNKGNENTIFSSRSNSLPGQTSPAGILPDIISLPMMAIGALGATSGSPFMAGLLGIFGPSGGTPFQRNMQSITSHVTSSGNYSLRYDIRIRRYMEYAPIGALKTEGVLRRSFTNRIVNRIRGRIMR